MEVLSGKEQDKECGIESESETKIPLECVSREESKNNAGLNSVQYIFKPESLFNSLLFSVIMVTVFIQVYCKFGHCKLTDHRDNV